MKYCGNCGKPYEEGIKFCIECGNPLLSANEASGKDYVKPSEKSNSVQYEILENSAENAGNIITKTPKRKIIIGISVVVIIIIVAAILVKPVFFVTNAEETDLSITFVKDNKQVHYIDKDFEKPILLTASLVDSDDKSVREIICNNIAQLSLISKKSPSGKEIAYLSSIDENTLSGDLRLQNTSKTENSDTITSAEVQISTRVLIYDFIDDNQVVYIKMAENDNSKITGDLYIYDISDDSSKKISSSIDYFLVAKDRDRLLLFKNASDEIYMNSFDLYLQSIDSDAEKIKIDSEIVRIDDYKPDFSEFVYSKSAGEEGLNYDVYRYNSNGKKKVATNIYYIESAEAGGNIYYYTNYDEMLGLEDIIDDDMAVADSGIIEPNYFDFIVSEQYYDSFFDQYYYNDEFDYDAYNEAYQKYLDKLSRDEIRNYILENPFTITKKDLYCISKDNKTTKIDKDVSSTSFIDMDNGKIIYLKQNSGQAEKTKISELESIYDMPFYPADATYSYYVFIPGEEPLLIFDKKTVYEDIAVNSDWTKIYYLYKQGDKQNGTLYGFDLNDNSISGKKEIRSDVGTFEINEDGSILLLTDKRDDIGDLYIMKDGKEKSFGTDVPFSSVIYLGNNDTYFIEDYSKEDESGTLVHYRNDSKTEIDSDVYSYLYFSSNIIYLYKDFNNSKFVWDIYRYDGSENIKNIDYDVSNVQYDLGASLEDILSILPQAGGEYSDSFDEEYGWD